MTGPIRAAEVVLPCAALYETIAFFTSTLGFCLEKISPADDPAVAVMSGHGVRVRLQRSAAGDPGHLRVLCSDPDALCDGARTLTAPNGTRIELVHADPPLVLPPLASSFVLTRQEDDVAWVQGRAGMRYRDLIPDRQGGRFIASHIAIPDGGPVPDYVHYHRLRFQMIYCYQGWTRLVYEDQGPPFVLCAGDCVLQPPEIRHRVLESSVGNEVIEIACPAEHETLAEHVLTLPTAVARPERVFGGQRFVHHRAADAAWQPWRLDGWVARDLGIAAATDGLASAYVARVSGAVQPQTRRHDGELLFLFVLQGAIELGCTGRVYRLNAGDCVVIPAGLDHAFAEPSGDAELLEVTLPAAPWG